MEDGNSRCVYTNWSPIAQTSCCWGIADCDDCRTRLRIDDPQFLDRWQDSLVILNRQRLKTRDLRNLIAGCPAFLLCGGPSANDQPLEKLSGRGMWSLAVNNMAGHPRIRPQAFVCSDPPSKFSHSIWLDPGIMKFVPTPKLTSNRRGSLRKKIDGMFSSLEKTTVDCPNIWGFQRNPWLTPDDQFFLSDGACWGNHDKGAKATNQAKTVCTMLLAIRILYYLGARTIFLVGVDFRMTPGRTGYSFNQERTLDTAASNNTQFQIVNEWLTKMQSDGVFRRFGLSVYNTFERSGLRAFPYVPFETAINNAAGIVEKIPDLSCWYNK